MSVTPIQMPKQMNVDKAASTSTPDVPFNQVLSHEMTQNQHLKKSDGDSNKVSTTKAQEKPDQPVEQAQATADTAPQVSAEMLALLGKLQPAQPATPVAGLTDADALAAQHMSDTDSLGTSRSTKKTVADLTDKLLADGKDVPIANARPDAKFSDLLNKNGIANKEPNIKLLEIEAKSKTTSVQTDALPIPVAIQASAVNMAQNITGQVTDKLLPRVGTPAWDQAFSQRIVWMASGAQQTASISLNPPDLGPLQVVLSVTNDQANATFIAAQPDTRLAIEAALPRLREMMSEAGIQLGQANVSADTSNQRGSQSDSHAPRHSSAATEISADNLNMARTTTTGLGLVNTFV